MKKTFSLLLALSLLATPVAMGAQSFASPTDHGVLVSAAKNTVKKAIKKSSKSSAKSVKAASKSSAKSSKEAVAESSSCAIKGNISATKEKIFHVLGCPNYGQTVIDTTKGERMFCSEQEARDAGWRKALNCS